MKKIFMLPAILLIIIANCSGGRSVSNSGLTIVPESTKSEYTIILSSTASPSEVRAAHELNKFIFEMTGASIPVESDTATPPEKCIIIGSGKALKAIMPDFNLADFGDEEYIIKTSGEHIIIAGGKLRGTMYGVYGFLQSLGCRWYSADASHIPKLKRIVIKSTDIREKPAFEYRDVAYYQSYDKDWCARNRVNGHFSYLDASTGGKVEYYPFVHSLNQLVPQEIYGREHPDWFGNGQLCLTNPEVLKVATANVLKWIADHPTATLISVSQSDAWEHCTCKNCMKAYAEEGEKWSGVLLRFVNAIAEEVEKTHPDKRIDTLAYIFTQNAPAVTKPGKNVRVRLCSTLCLSHTPAMCNVPGTVAFIKTLADWSAITDNLYIWHYDTNFSNYLYPFPHFDQIAASAKMYAKSGVRGIFWEGAHNSASSFMAELSSYLLARLSWNPDLNYKEIMKEFVDGYYEDAASYIWEFIWNMQAYTQSDKDYHMLINCSPNQPYLTESDMVHADELFDKAEASVSEKPDVLKRVQTARLSLTYAEIMTPMLNKTVKDKAALLEKFEKFAADCKTRGGYISEGMTLNDSLNNMRAQINKIP